MAEQCCTVCSIVSGSNWPGPNTRPGKFLFVGVPNRGEVGGYISEDEKRETKIPPELSHSILIVVTD